jgi:AI-2 transport protein TqsA
MGTASPDQRTQTICLLILSAVALAVGMLWLSPVLIPLTLAFLLTVCLEPVIDFQTVRLRMPRAVAILTTALLGCAILLLCGVVIAASVAQMTSHADTYAAKFQEMFDRVAHSIPLERFGVDPGSLDLSMLRIPSGAVQAILTGTISAIMSILSNGMLVLIFMMFLIMGRTQGVARGELWTEIDTSIKRYILIKVLVSALTGVLVGLVLSLLGVDLALVFGLFAFLLNFIPSIGSVIATLLPLPVVLLDPQMGTGAKFLAFLIPGAIQFVIGNVVEPKVMGKSLDLHPVTVLIALIFFGMIWGVLGMFLAAPLTAVLKMLLERLEYTRPIAEAFAGRLGGDHPVFLKSS